MKFERLRRKVWKCGGCENRTTKHPEQRHCPECGAYSTLYLEIHHPEGFGATDANDGPREHGDVLGDDARVGVTPDDPLNRTPKDYPL